MSAKKNLKLCEGHKQEWKQSHYAEHNCDHCKLELAAEGFIEIVTDKAIEIEKLKQQNAELLAAINDVLDGTPLDEYNRDDDGMNFSLNRNGCYIERWRKRLLKATAKNSKS